jgi:hypothetical protein
MAGAFQRHVAGIVGRHSPAGKASSVANQFLRQLESRDWLVEGGVQDKRQMEHCGLSNASHSSILTPSASADLTTAAAARIIAGSNTKTLQCLFDFGVEAPVQVNCPSL